MSQQFFGKFWIYQEYNIDNKLSMKELRFEIYLKLIFTNPFLWRLSGIQQMRLRTRQLCHFLVYLRWFCTQVETSSCLPVYPNIHGPVHHHLPFISNHHLAQYWQQLMMYLIKTSVSSYGPLSTAFFLRKVTWERVSIEYWLQFATMTNSWHPTSSSKKISHFFACPWNWWHLNRLH